MWAGFTGCWAVVLRLVSACWCVRLVPRLEQAHLWEGPGILVLVPAHWWEELGTRVSGWRVLGVLDLVPVLWCVEPGPGASSVWGQVQGQLWA